MIEHLVNPRFMLVVKLTESGDQTHLSWEQEFESPEMAAKMRPLSEGANEQVLNRLGVVLGQAER